ncbi:hypothetical protein LTR78_006159 [Recurvomyces mirabilis]|uniref:NTF2-like domain-containing protein n=1 Tax=Recurvomyces mirabilis TaxID=574656 RepID=A0AAE1C0D9_9PEZI|nr:hypothetical protein LTR78_006159 [Recurvomyces mirabilis]KAK5152001.1 hypothetical protein LTS14_008775 [Recurvomyces mirabilis]
MRSFIAVAALAAFAYAAPEPIFGQSKNVARDDGSCMSSADADQVAINFQNLISNYSSSLAEASLTTGFQDYSDSVTSLIDAGCTGPQPLGSVTFASRDAFIAGQGSQPNIPFERLNLWYGCDAVFLRWRTTIAPGAPEFVTGIIVLETTQAAAGSENAWLINTVYSEFNSGAWLVDLGTFVPSNCTNPSRRLLRN